MDLLSNPILLALSGVVGILIGLLLSNLFAENKKPDIYELPKELKKEGYTEVARLWYSPAGRKILTGLDGGVYKQTEDLSPDQRKRMTRLAQLFQEWVTVKEVSAETPAAPVDQPPQVPAATIPTKKEPVQSQEAADLGSFHYVAIPEEIVKKPVDYIPEEKPQAVFLPSEDEIGFALEEPELKAEPNPDLTMTEQPKKAPLSIVEQIDEILQHLAVGTPLEKRGITLQDDQHNGVIVYVGGEKYNGVEAVPYPEVQTLIRDAVAEWERGLEAKKNLPK